MEYEPEQIELLIHKVASTLGNRLEGLLFQQKNILDNQLNQIMIHHDGQAESITSDEIEGAYEIATIHNGHPGYFLCGWEDYQVGLQEYLIVKNQSELHTEGDGGLFYEAQDIKYPKLIPTWKPWEK